MDNCPNVNLDSLYLSYIPIVQNTKNDLAYCLSIKRFLANFNNGHTRVYNYPRYLNFKLGWFFITTIYKDGKIIISNFEKKYADKLHIGDEICMINGIKTMDYFQKYIIPYVPASNEEYKIHEAMFAQDDIHITHKDEKMTLEIKTSKGIKKVTIYADLYLNNHQEKMQERVWQSMTFENMGYYLFAIDTVESFAYIRMGVVCDQNLQRLFADKYPAITTVKNLIIDMSANRGGSSQFTEFAVHSLLNKDTIFRYKEKSKTHNASVKGYVAMILRINPDFELEQYPEEFRQKGMGFQEDGYRLNYENPVASQDRYKGKIYVIIGRNTVSAGEDFVLKLSQDKNITFLGEKTAGAMGNIYPILLPSGLEIIMSVKKTYDYQNNDISCGISPDYEYDFSEFYKVTSHNEILNKFIKVIQDLETTK
jgi:C-terminal processing protease CtpA/Prc